MAKYEKLKKHLNYLFINTAPGSAVGSEEWARVGKSTEWTDTMNAKTSTYDYIEDSSPTDVIESYQPSTSMPLTADIGDPVYEYVFDLYSRQETDATTKAMRVFQNKNSTGDSIAQVTNCTITIENFNIATGVITFVMKQSGTPIPGTAEVVQGTDTNGNITYTPTFEPDGQ
jgi:hypothetical protein